MEHKIESVSQELIDRGKCRHYWVIEGLSGPTSRGVCKLCGAEREFTNFVSDSWWGNSPSTGLYEALDVKPETTEGEISTL